VLRRIKHQVKCASTAVSVNQVIAFIPAEKEPTESTGAPAIKQCIGNTAHQHQTQDFQTQAEKQDSLVIMAECARQVIVFMIQVKEPTDCIGAPATQ